MAFLLDQAYLPAVLTAPPMTDEEFLAFCAEHDDLWFETTAEGQLLVMPPNHPFTDAQNREIIRQLGNWSLEDGRGVSFGSSGAFVTAGGARRSPDAAWVLKSRIPAGGAERTRQLWHLSPDFVIELRSPSDRLTVLREKMREWIESGVAVAWLIDPETRSVEIYHTGQPAEIACDPASVTGDGPVAGFVLELASVWDPIQGLAFISDLTSDSRLPAVSASSARRLPE